MRIDSFERRWRRDVQRGLLFAAVAGVALPAACAAQPGAPSRTTSEAVDSARVLDDLRRLSDPSMAGRAAGTPGNEAARAYIEAALLDAGAKALPGAGLRQSFQLTGGASTSDMGTGVGVNLIGYIPGSEDPGHFIVLTAHYDHLGVRGGELYPGADDNASGSAALLELARYFSSHPPRNSIIIAALDAEEGGLRGARYFVDNPPVPLDSIGLVINMDMIGRNDRRELFVAGTYHYPFLSPLVDEVAASSRLSVRKGHDRPDGSAGDDWTQSSDHGPFHTAGVPFLYFGVEDHQDYHRPSDSFDGIQRGFFVEAVRTILRTVVDADARLDEIRAAAGR